MASLPIHSIASDVLARHIRRDIRTVRMWHSLDRDLDLTPLELVLVALEIEESGHVHVSVEELATVETVGDLFMCLSKAVVYSRDIQACA
jgi:hypothetical protein